MSFLIVVGLLVLAYSVSRRARRRPLPGPVVSMLVLIGFAMLLGQFWLVNLAAVFAVIYLLQAWTRPARRIRRVKSARRQLPRREYWGDWAEARQELQDDFREFEVDLRQFLSEFDRNLERAEGTAPHAPAAPAPREVAASAPAPTDECSRFVEQLLREKGRQLPPEAVRRIQSLQAKITETMEYLRATGREEGEVGFLVRQTALDYLPGAVNAYLRLPPSLADQTPLQAGKTGRDLLLEQLQMLHEAVERVLGDAARAEASALLAHKRFLEERLSAPKKEFEL